MTHSKNWKTRPNVCGLRQCRYTERTALLPGRSKILLPGKLQARYIMAWPTSQYVKASRDSCLYWWLLFEPQGDIEINGDQFVRRLLLHRLKILMPSTWPEDCSTVYGEGELKFACEKFRVRFTGELKQQYSYFKDSKGSGRGARPSIETFSWCHSHLASQYRAECERGFSRMNLICTPFRSTITVKHIYLMFIRLVGLPIDQW